MQWRLSRKPWGQGEIDSTCICLGKAMLSWLCQLHDMGMQCRGRLKELHGLNKQAKSGQQRAEDRAQHGGQGHRPHGMANRRFTADAAAGKPSPVSHAFANLSRRT